MAKKPSLTALMDKGAQSTDDLAPAPSAAPRKVGKRMGWVQINVYVPEELRAKAKVKALQKGRDLSDVVADLLTTWVGFD